MPAVSYDKTNDVYLIRLGETLKSGLGLDPEKTYEWNLTYLDSENKTFCVEIKEVV